MDGQTDRRTDREQISCKIDNLTVQVNIHDGVGDAGPDDVIVQPPETPRPVTTKNSDSSRFLLHENDVATMTYVARVPAALSRWTVAVSLSPADWTPSSDQQLIHIARQLLDQLQAAIDQLMIQRPTSALEQLVTTLLQDTINSDSSNTS